MMLFPSELYSDVWDLGKALGTVLGGVMDGFAVQAGFSVGVARVLGCTHMSTVTGITPIRSEP